MALAVGERSSCGRLRERMRSESRMRYLAWRALGIKRPLIVKLTGGERLILRKPPAGDLSVAHEVFVQEIYRSPRQLPAVSMIVDVGANTGFALLYLGYRYPLAKVIGFEPHPAHLALLNQHLRINQLLDRVMVMSAAAGTKERTAFLLDEGERSRVVENGRLGRIPIAVADFFSTIERRRIDLLKLDCEGGEYELIMDERFASLEVGVIALEWHSSAHRPNAGEELQARLTRLGFALTAEVEKETSGRRSGMLWAYRE